MRFTDFDVEYDEDGGNCSYDSVTVYEDEVENPKLCGRKNIQLDGFEKRNGNKTFFATKQIKIHFISDNMNMEQYGGWRAVFRLGE